MKNVVQIPKRRNTSSMRTGYWRNVNLIPLLFCALVLASCASNPAKQDQRYYLAKCDILDENFEIVRKLPQARYCELLPDGSWVSMTPTGLTRFSPDGDTLWTYAGFFSHQLRLSGEHDLLAIKQIRQDSLPYATASDLLVRINVETGQLEASFSLADNERAMRNLRKTEFTGAPVWITRDAPDAKVPFYFEFSHVNALSEIPQKARSNFGGGRYLANDAISGLCFALDDTMKSVVWSKTFTNASGSPLVTHDCHALDDGSLIYFANHQEMKAGTESFQVVNELTGKIIFQYPRAESDFVVATSKGGAERLPEGYLYTIGEIQGQDAAMVAIVSPDGRILKKKVLPVQLLDVRPLQNANFLILNKVR